MGAQDTEEQDTCRICSAPAEPGQPLFHPCKCSGTIRYIHQDCLTTWLAHSKKKTCDVCKYRYTFTKVYAPNMPKQLPVILFLRRLVKQTFFLILLAMRGTLVASVWLALLPWMTVWIWRLCFFVGGHIAYWINERPYPYSSPFGIIYMNATVISDSNGAPINANSTIADLAQSYPVWLSLSSDIFTGQIIASLIVLTFLGVFLLREWIVQNARPGVFEDNEIEPERQENAEEAPAAQNPEDLAPGLAVVEQAAAGDHDEHETPNTDDASTVVSEASSDSLFTHSAAERSGQGLDAAVNPQQTSDSHESNYNASSSSGRLFKNAKGKSPYRWSSDETVSTDDLGTDMSRPPQRRRRLSLDASGSGRRRVNAFRRSGVSRRSRAQREGREKGKKPIRSAHHKPEHENEGEDANHRLHSRSVSLDADFNFTFNIDEIKSINERYRRWSESPPPSSSLNAPSPPSHPFHLSPEEQAEPSLQALPPPTRPLNRPPLPSTKSINVQTDRPLIIDISSPSIGPRVITFENGINEALSASPSGSRRLPSPLPQSDTGPMVVDLAKPLVDFRLEGENGGPSTPSGSGQSIATYRPPEDLNAEAGANPENPPRQLRKVVHVQIHDSNGQPIFEEFFRDADADAIQAAGINNLHINMPDPQDTDEDEWDDHDVAEADGDAVEEDNRHGHGHRVPRAPEIPGRNRAGNIDAQAAGLNPVQEPNADDANIEDDMDGALEDVLEAIGLRGPLTSIIQNLALMTFALAITLTLGICVPFTIGKTTAMLVLEPPRLIAIIHFPIRLIRYVTDPVVDSFFYILRRLLVPLLFRLVQPIIPGIAMNKHALFDQPKGTAEISDKDIDIISFNDVTNSILSSQFVAQCHMIADQVFAADSYFMRYAGIQFAALGKRVRLIYTASQGLWFNLASGDTALDRLFGVMLGYTVIGFFIALYLNVLNVGTVQSAGRAVRNAVRQQLIIVKVAVFIIIEMVIFPLGCGVVVDFAAMRVFPDVNLASRLAFAAYAPITAGFYHWMIGTIFMYVFAVTLGGCRTVMRPGAMWFIKDPQDQSFHPIRDILDRPTLTQLRKLVISAGIYAVVVLSTVGSLVLLFRIFGMCIVPLRWRMREPLSEVPLDLLFLHLVVPNSVYYIRPRKVLRNLVTRYWKWAAHQLRFTSYMFGGRYPNEEALPKTWTWEMLFESSENSVPVDPSNVTLFTGSLRRVPAMDRVALLKDTSATVAVDEKGEALDEAGRLVIEAQNNEAVRLGRNPKDDYTVVYIPPGPRRRAIAFIVLMWLAVSVSLVAAITLPIHLGRGVFSALVGREVHDGYSFVAGFYILWGCFIFGKTLNRMDKRRQRLGGDEPRGPWYLYVIKRSLLWFSKIAWLTFWFGIVIPTLIAIVMQLYVVNPLVLFRKPGEPTKIHMVQTWAVGVLYTQMAMKTVRLRPQGRFDVAISRIKQNGWRRPDVVDATLNLILPLTGGLLAMIVLPMLLIMGVQWLVKIPLDQDTLFALVYPAIFVAVAFARLGHALILLCASWAQSIRDSEFLVEMRLQNLEASESQRIEITDKRDDEVPDEPPPNQAQVPALQAENNA